MTNPDIETFFAVLQHGTLSAAAEALYISQPTLTARMQALEGEVGAELFHRGKGQRRICLTDAGERFLPPVRPAGEPHLLPCHAEGTAAERVGEALPRGSARAPAPYRGRSDFLAALAIGAQIC